MSPNPTPAAEFHLGLDFGTSGARANLIDVHGSLVHEAALKFSRNTYPEWREALWHLLASVPADYRARIAGIAICGTSSTSLLCDQEGEPLFPALLYNDNRAAEEVALIQASAPPGHIWISASSSLAKLLWLSKQPQSASARYFMHQADWLAFLLHGKAGLSDYHNTLKLGFDVELLCYPAWLQALVNPALLPKVAEPGTDLGVAQPEIEKRYGLNPACRIYAGTTDSNAALIAGGAHQPGQALTSLGSTMVLKLLSEQRVEAAAYGVYSHRFGKLWLASGASNCGGAVLERIFGHEELQRLSLQIKLELPTNLDYYPLPATGERFPVNDPELKPRLEPRPNDDALYLQGLLESLARIEAQGYALLESLGATPVSEVLTAGGGAENKIWATIRSRAMGKPVNSAQHSQAAYGMALLAKQGVKLFDSFF